MTGGPPGDRDPTHRFQDRAEAYVRGRPGYPDAAVTLATEGLRREARVVDVGAGTGILTRKLLEHGLEVIALEPNAAMRDAAAAYLGDPVALEIVEGTAEAMPVADASIDLVTCAQTFHWVDPTAFRRECHRVLRAADGRVAILWNQRRTSGTPFAEAYEAFLQRHGTDYAEVSARYEDPASLRAFFGDAAPERRAFPHGQDLDLEGLRARAVSSSYLPGPDDAGHQTMLDDLRTVFLRHAGTATGGQAAVVAIPYDCVVYVGRPAAMG